MIGEFLTVLEVSVVLGVSVLLIVLLLDAHDVAQFRSGKLPFFLLSLKLNT